MTRDLKQRNRGARIASEGGVSLGGSTLLSLSLFIILLAFFIVLNSISSYSEPKVEQAFTSLDLAFAARIIPSEFESQSADERAGEGENKGQGESMEDMQGVLNSILPGLNVNLTENPTGGHVMAVRMEKARFERLTPQLIPLFARILNIKDGEGEYELFITSYVRDSLNEDARLSFSVLQGYRGSLIEKGLSPDRIALGVELGNPAYMLFRFDKRKVTE